MEIACATLLPLLFPSFRLADPACQVIFGTEQKRLMQGSVND